jgi:hypothetical protein
MITILEKPKKKCVKLFRCMCGCTFTAEPSDYTLCPSMNKEFDYYTIECPYCHITRIYPYAEVDTIQVDVE